MVFVWGSGWGGRRRGPGPGWGGGRGYGPGYGRGGWGPPPGYGYRGGGGGGGCLRDLLLLNTGCCLAEALGCGVDAALLAPTTLRSAARQGCAHDHRHDSPHEHPRGRAAGRLAAVVRVYQREVSPRRPPVCRFTPTCSQYALDALEGHGALRGSWLTLRRLVRCRPGAAGGADPVPAPRAA
jgi:putative membrane protein insertion efficiency factor